MFKVLFNFSIAFLIVLVLIGVTVWLVRLFRANRLGGAARRPQSRRLAVIDAARVDGSRSVVLIRRDNIEHLLMIGGATDVVIEANIMRATGARVGAGPCARTARLAANCPGSLRQKPLCRPHTARHRASVRRCRHRQRSRSRRRILFTIYRS
jgi:hypothetical protein